MFAKFYARHLRNPSGLFGRWVARRMNALNAEASRLTVKVLNPRTSDKVLEIGFGGGETLSRLLVETPSGTVHGLEISETMMRAAKSRFTRELSEGRLHLAKSESEEALPYFDDFFDRVCSLNTIYFWSHPLEMLQEIVRVTKPGGRIAIEFNPKETFQGVSFTRYGFHLCTKDDVFSFFHQLGLSNIQTAESADIDGGFIVISAEKPV